MNKIKRKEFKEKLKCYDSIEIGKMLENAKTIKEKDGFCSDTLGLYCSECPLDYTGNCTDYKIPNTTILSMKRNSDVEVANAKNMKRFHKNIDKIIEILEECK